MSQTRFESFKEQLVSKGIAFVGAFVVWEWIIRPLIHADILSIDDSLYITLIFTVIGLIRGYSIRRWFNARSD